MSPFQEAFDRIKVVGEELATMQRTLDEKLADPVCVGSLNYEVSEARANSERTYLLRLFAEFEGSLEVLGPNLNPPCNFGPQDGLAQKLNRIGSLMGVDNRLRMNMDSNVRDVRNELMHGRSRIPRVPFDQVRGLMLAFLRW